MTVIARTPVPTGEAGVTATASHRDRARVVEMRTQIRVHLPTASPAQAVLRHVLGRIPRFAT